MITVKDIVADVERIDALMNACTKYSLTNEQIDDIYDLLDDFKDELLNKKIAK